MSNSVRNGPSWGRTIAAGIVWGVLGAAVMGMFAMIAAATYQKTGFFTPMHHIASTFIEPASMMRSMEAANKGDMFVASGGAALLGMMIHLGVGAAYGAVFAVVVRVAKLRGAAAFGGALVYAIIVLLFSSFVALPIAAKLFGGGDPIANMPSMVGWSTFTVEHLIYGAVLGLGPILAPSAFASLPEIRSAAQTRPA